MDNDFEHYYNATIRLKAEVETLKKQLKLPEGIEEKIAEGLHRKERILYSYFNTPQIIPALQFKWNELPVELKLNYLNQAKYLLSRTRGEGGHCY